MSSQQVIQTPITGREEPGELDEPIQALAQFYRAFNGRDLALMAENWEDSEGVAMDNPLGGIKRGWAEIRSVYERIFAGAARVQVAFYDYTLHVIGDVFYAVGRERGTFERGGKKLDLAIRTTRIFRRSGGRWRQVHHHGSIDDPSLLGAYQEAVR
jgi:ketosteroid isomerase-like protein